MPGRRQDHGAAHHASRLHCHLNVKEPKGDIKGTSRGHQGHSGSHSRGANTPEFCLTSCLPEEGGRRECRMRNAPAASRTKVESTRVSHYRYVETIRHSLRNGFRLIRALPGVPGFLATVPRALDPGVDPSVGGSGPHDFAVRTGRARLARLCVHRIPHPTFVTIGRNAPPEGAGCGEISTYF